MIKKKKTIAVVLCVLFGSVTSATTAYISYTFWMPITPNETTALPYEPDSTYEIYDIYDETRLASGATIVYRHHDKRTGQTTEQITNAPSFMINRTQHEIATVFNEWQVINFESHEMVLERTIETLPLAAYTLSLSGDFIAIFRGQLAHNNLLEITTITANHLPPVERERLERGIFVANRHELIRRLEDFST